MHNEMNDEEKLIHGALFDDVFEYLKPPKSAKYDAKVEASENPSEKYTPSQKLRSILELTFGNVSLAYAPYTYCHVFDLGNLTFLSLDYTRGIRGFLRVMGGLPKINLKGFRYNAIKKGTDDSPFNKVQGIIRRADQLEYVSLTCPVRALFESAADQASGNTLVQQICAQAKIEHIHLAAGRTLSDELSPSYQKISDADCDRLAAHAGTRQLALPFDRLTIADGKRNELGRFGEQLVSLRSSILWNGTRPY